MVRVSMNLLRVLMFVALAMLEARATFISDEVVHRDRGSSGRTLLQASQSCPLNFEFMNYTIITTQCKGPQYLADKCCGAFKQFACPFASELNDVTNECATIMFSYINLYGKYPPGLFQSECKEGKQGLACPASSPQAAEGSGSTGRPSRSLASVVVPLSAMLLGFLLLLN